MLTWLRSHLNSIFQPVVGRIVDLVRTQVNEVEEVTSKKPKVRAMLFKSTNFETDNSQAVLLVGGFGENNFVLEQLTQTFPIPIQRPTKA